MFFPELGGGCMGAYWSRMAVCTPVAGPPHIVCSVGPLKTVSPGNSKVCRISSLLGAL